MRIYISAQRRGVPASITRELRRRSAVEPVIGHLKNEHRLGRNFLAGSVGDAINCPFRRSRSAVPSHLDQAFRANAISGVWGA